MPVMAREHPDWGTFYRALSHAVLCGPESCNHSFSGAASIEHFKAQGAYCDCEIVLRMGPRVIEELHLLRERLIDLMAAMGSAKAIVRNE